ncbi:spry domain containing socs box protein [Anaeramoeba flamelloides]|uniref:Spry domain containing socs box protein n=1 Tax=Anaeramoeba flamelloides TaxID=1746091 RepID=A0AAV7YQ08_9EUKA|nr:spry domain containing socs box protein [Anaeramoeba flamelloides]|eukprot:Anaeramoba_flamelloidesa809826_198.p1 GENE.a809826_198~~a809826_198.p1  ORF type:complete len:168 (-),score=28.49 a809826_198:117-620(-)
MAEADEYDKGDMFDPKTCLGGVILSNKNRTAKTDNNSTGDMTVQGTKEYTTGVHEVKIKIDSGSGINWYVGVCRSGSKSVTYNSGNAYYFDVFCSSQSSSKVFSGRFSAYSNKCNTGTIVTIIIDMNKKELSFRKGNQDLGVAFTGLPEKVKISTQMRHKNRQLSIL